MEAKTEDADRTISFKSAQAYVVGNDKGGSQNTGNCDVGSDCVNNDVDTREIISRVKPDFSSRLK